MNVLILGAHGFIGSHVVDHFCRSPDVTVWGADIALQGEGNYLSFDPTRPDFSSLVRASGFDFCINCTGAANVSESIKDPARDFQLNTANVLNLLDALRVHSPRTKFLNLSSAAIYGNPRSLPVRETDQAQPISPYGVHKQMAELICDEYYRHFGIGTCSVRIFSAYGPGLRKQIVWDLYQKTLQGPEVRLGGTGNETRDFVFIADIVTALELLIRKAPFHGDVYNLSSGVETRIGDLARLVLEGLASPAPLVFDGKTRPGDPLNWRADISPLRALGFTPAFTIEQGVAECVKWLKGLE